MPDYLDLLKRKEQLRSGSFTPTMSTTAPKERDDFILDPEASLKKDDLKNNQQYLNSIRDYMVRRKGTDYKTLDPDTVVEDFVDHMRYFNANTVSTAGEVRFISKADEDTKFKAKKAYQLYEQLGNVFQNDGVAGAVDGVKDYVFATATDPSNYIGVATGGIARAFAGGGRLFGKKVIADSIRKARMDAIASGANKAAAKKAAENAGKEAIKRAVQAGMTKKKQQGLYDKVHDRVYKDGRRALVKKAMDDAQQTLYDEASGKALKGTIAIDAGMAMLQDNMAQNTLMEVGAQEKYSRMQTGLSAFLGGIAGGAQLGFGKFRGASGLADERDPLDRVANVAVEELAPIFKKKDMKTVAASIKKEVKAWNQKVEDGRDATTATMPADMIKHIMLGDDNQGGLARIFKDKKMKLSRKKTVSDVLTNVATFLPDKELADINKEMRKYTGIQIGDAAEDGTQLGDFLSKDISAAGQTLNVMSQVRKTLDSSLIAASERLTKTLDEVNSKEEIGLELKKAKKSEGIRYGQSVWKRLLVSSPATTAVNVAGFGQYYIGQTVADLFNSTGLAAKGLGQLALGRTAGASDTFRRAKALTAIQAQKLRNFADPYTTHDTYMKLLEENNDARKILFETISGGIEVNAERYGIDPKNKLYRNIEAGAKAAADASGVRVQDSFTKSQMFITEMDKYLRISKDVTLKEALLSDENLIDDSVMQAAIDGTLKSVYSKDYTSKDQPQLLRSTAKLVETISNTPGIGTLLPFGRFMNNVVATAYQWSPFATPQFFYQYGRRIAKSLREGKAQDADLQEGEVLSRILVGSTAGYMAMQYDKQRQEKKLGVYEVEGPGGAIIDAKNTFPFSVFLAVGRALNIKSQGQDVPRELIQEIGTQLAVGQVSRDFQFANDLNNLLDVLINEDGAKRGDGIHAFAKASGNLLAGVTRPLDAVNKIAGFASGTDTAKDVRQADALGAFTQTATKYVDNIFEALFDKTETLTGEELRVATRQGEVYDANPYARTFGLTVKPSRTSTEIAYSMAEMFPWTASERTKVPAYDKIFNQVISPVLEKKTDVLIRTKQFNDATLEGKRNMLSKLISDTKSDLRKRMEKGLLGADARRLKAAAKAMNVKKGIRKEALLLMKQQYGVEAAIDEMSPTELDLFMDIADYLKDLYDLTDKM